MEIKFYCLSKLLRERKSMDFKFSKSKQLDLCKITAKVDGF